METRAPAAISPHRPVLQILAAFSRYPAAFDWTRHLVEQAWGPIQLQSQLFDHRETSYYEATMGPELCRWPMPGRIPTAHSIV